MSSSCSISSTRGQSKPVASQYRGKLRCHRLCARGAFDSSQKRLCGLQQRFKPAAWVRCRRPGDCARLRCALQLPLKPLNHSVQADTACKARAARTAGLLKACAARMLIARALNPSWATWPARLSLTAAQSRCCRRWWRWQRTCPPRGDKPVPLDHSRTALSKGMRPSLAVGFGQPGVACRSLMGLPGPTNSDCKTID